jgi:murein DD-endopeptidase MepM/ murein hydrolase activator NlpD
MIDPRTAKMALQLSAALTRHRGLRYVVVGLVLASIVSTGAVVFGPWLLTTQMAASLRSQQQSQTDGGSCADTGFYPLSMKSSTVPSLTTEQVGHAQTIWHVAQVMKLGDRAAVVAIATALQESALRNLSYGDRDSVGLFQQRAGWGAVAVRMDPQQSARLFYVTLANVSGWERMSLTRAAQAVQRSAFPDAYAKHEKTAAGLVALFRAKVPVGSPDGQAALASAMCGNAFAAQCPATGMAMEATLTPDALRTLRCVKHRWPQLTTFGGVANRPATVDRDHQEGRAIDAMIPGYQTAAGRQLGESVASWAVANHAKVGVRYVIWDGRIWSLQRAKEGWRTCGSSRARCYAGADDTAAHRDHVHISVFGNEAGASVAGLTGPAVRPLDQYVLTATFGRCSSLWARCHTGLDFSAATGAPIKTIMGGTVVYTGWGGAYGNLTKVRHRNGLESWYAHQSRRTVSLGQEVTAGQVIGAVGATGNTTGPHLHLEVRVGGNPVDPEAYLSARGVAP